ncbi:hypothetical protein PHYBOEH_010192 [Phytophthora boehmeriae]|uniref:Septum formation protein Maf n=1 Tax=Phytophthora boehmeriae TaxID=109152 RepID=A0A8T1X366_9STRA|nr:hypothetical protein PHYBOEH_010192 [Phytophthora boehmeriae]
MLSAVLTQLRSRRVILASQSPRRLELLRDCGLTFEVIPSTFEENLPKERFATPDLYVVENAKQKALEVLNRMSKNTTEGKHPLVVIGCDTVVVYDGVILEKPKDEDDAFAMLTKLSGRPHEVYSGVALFTAERGGENPHVFFEKTSVVFGPLEPADIRAYIATGEPMDKAGSYGLQGRARCFVQEIHGCTNNVIGFPVQRFCQELKQLATKEEL